LADNSNSLSQNTRFSAKDIRTALEILAPSLGRSNVEMLVHGLSAFGLELSNDQNSYTMGEIEQAINELFTSAAPIILASLKKALSARGDLTP
jgi:hypothetical protein